MAYFFYTFDGIVIATVPFFNYNTIGRDVAQLGSALPWGGRGREFESHRSDHFFIFYDD